MNNLFDQTPNASSKASRVWEYATVTGYTAMHEEMSSSSPKRSKANRLKSKLAQAGVVGLFWLYLPELLLYAW